MHSVYHFYLVNQPNFVFIIFKISCSCTLYSLHLECNLSPHLVIKIIIYIQSNFFRRYILTVWLPYWQTQITQLNSQADILWLHLLALQSPKDFQVKTSEKFFLHFLYRFIFSLFYWIKNVNSIRMCFLISDAILLTLRCRS